LPTSRSREVWTPLGRPRGGGATVRRLPRLPVLLGAALLLAGGTLLGGGGLVAQAPIPTTIPSPSPFATPSLTNVGTSYYVDNGMIYSAAKTCASWAIG
jgi:hypothetical protein